MSIKDIPSVHFTSMISTRLFAFHKLVRLASETWYQRVELYKKI